MACVPGPRKAAEAAVAVGDGLAPRTRPGGVGPLDGARRGERPTVAIEMVRRRVQTRLDRKRTGPDEWLVVTRCPLADEGTLKGPALPDAGDQDTRYGYRYYLTPTCVEPWRNRRWGNWRASSKRERAMNYLAASCEVSNPCGQTTPGPVGGELLMERVDGLGANRTPPIGHLDDAVAYRLVHCLAAAHIGG